MPVVRDTVLMPGFYWIDSFPGKGFTAWTQQQKGLVKVRASRSHLDEKPPREWVLFEVLFPAVWDKRMGFPTTAPKGAATTEEDTRDAPDLSTSLFDTFNFGALGDAGGLLVLAVIAYVALGDGRR